MKTANRKFLLFSAMIGMALVGLESCSKSSGSSGPPPPQPIGGFVSSDSVEPQALVAYFPFDGDANDHKGGAAANAVGASYVTGIRGNAWQGSAGAYATLVPTTALKTLQSFSVAVWYWQPAQPTSSPNTPQGIFFMVDTAGHPDMILENEPYKPVSGDSLRIHTGFYTPAAKSYNYWVMETFDTMAIGKWVHLAFTYDGGSSNYIVYQNGQPMLNQSAYGKNLTTQLLDGPANATPANPPLGNINYSSDPPSQVVIGTWPAGLFGVSPTLGANGAFMGKIDDLRVFNIALTAKDVAGLYLNGQAGR